MELDFARGGRHPRIIEGDGSKEKPFVIDSNNPYSSALIQKNIVTFVTDLQIEQLSIVRFYCESPRGLPGNGDLCQYQIKVGDEFASIWFDLYLVTKQGKEAGVPQDPVAFITNFKELAQDPVPENQKESDDKLSQLPVTQELKLQKTESDKKEPPPTVDNKAVSSVGTYYCSLLLIELVLIPGFAIWAFYSSTNRIKSDRIIFGLITATTTFLAFRALYGLIGPWVSGHVAKLLTDSKTIKMNPYDMWFTRLFAVLGTLRIIVTAGTAIYFVLQSRSPYYNDLWHELFFGFTTFCIVYLICDIGFSLLFLVLGTICWIFDHRTQNGPTIQRTDNRHHHRPDHINWWGSAHWMA